jgi:erythromycin esterase-like protein
MPRDESKDGIYRRAARRAASATADREPGIGTTVDRTFAMLGSLVREAISPTEDLPTESRIREQAAAHKKNKAAKKARDSEKASAKKAAERDAARERAKKAREPFEGATPWLDGVRNLGKSD